MILPIVAYGDAVLKKKAKEINKEYPNLDVLLENMYETMYGAMGVGLAAPQIGLPIRLFLVETGDEWAFNEGCLSIPDVREDVFRQPKIKIQYQDENFETYVEEYEGLIARVIQHEYDHIEGVLFTDKLSSFKKRLIKGRLTNISKGKIRIDYKMRFPAMSKKR